MDDEKELRKVLNNYQQVVINGSKNVLEDLREIVQNCKRNEYERVHFHFSGKYTFFGNPLSKIKRRYICIIGHGKDSARVAVEVNKGGEDDALEAQNPAGECVVGTGMTAIASSVHEIKVELSKMNTKKITMTLDCCRTVSRGLVVVDMK